MAVLQACSIVDHGQDYQTSRSNKQKLIVSDGQLESRDKFVIPYEDKIPSYDTTKEFVSPSVPEQFIPFANFEIVWEEGQMWINTDAKTSNIKPVITQFFTTLNSDEKPLKTDNDSRLETVAIPFVKQGWLASLWSSITRLYPEKAVYEVTFVENLEGTRVGLRYQTQQKGQEGVLKTSEWLSPAKDERVHAIALDLWTELSTQLLNASNTESLSSRDSSQPNTLWLDKKGNYAIRLEVGSTEQDFMTLVEASELYVASKKPLQVSFIPVDQIPKVGDLKKLKIPAFGGGKELVLGNVKRRNLDDLEWNQRAYNIELVRRTNGVFVTVDTNITEEPNLVSYKIMKELFKN